MFNPLSILRSAALVLLVVASFSAGAQRFQAGIKNYLLSEKSNWHLSDLDISDYAISDQYDNASTGITYTYLNQRVSGIEIFNAVSTMIIRDGKVVYYANRFHPDAAKKANAITPAINAQQAIEAASAHLGLTILQQPTLLEKDPNRLRSTFTRAGISKEDIIVQLVLVSQPEALRLAWNVILAPIGTADWWNIRIDALNGQFIEKNNWTTYCSFGNGHSHDQAGVVSDHVMKTNTGASQATSGMGTYNVFPLPVEAPSFGSRLFLNDPRNILASPYGWHDTDGFDGPEFTITRGNNVYAYEDLLSFDSPGYSPDGGPQLNFDFPLDLYRPTIQNQDAALSNLFYVNNMVHDILYAHGFDEASGNFQQTNYSPDGFGEDFVVAEGQDGGGLNNANFSTPVDGLNGRMQMYMWGIDVKGYLEINGPESIAGHYDALPATFGPTLDIPVTGFAALVKDAVDPFGNACDSIVNGGELIGKIAIIDRGNCPYIKKVNAAEAAGAIGVIVVSNSSAPVVMGGGTSGIPAIMISQVDGERIKSQLNAGENVEVTLLLGPSDRDGSVDNGIIVHEYGHGLSNRLTGGPLKSDCLYNAEQGGEGWSDWLALLLTIEPGDKGTDARGMGTYAANDDSDEGLRRYPYSTDMSINPQTYGDVAGNQEVHATGEIWCMALWEMTWALIDAEGFDPDWYNGTGGNNTALRLVIEGLKWQPCSPGYEEARDAIIHADTVLYEGAHRCLIWEAFAKRGLGAYADQGVSSSTFDQTEDFEIPNTCKTAILAPTAAFAVDNTVDCNGHFIFKDKSLDIPQYFQWDFGDGNTSHEERPKHSYTVPGEYTVTLIVSNTIGADTIQQNVVFGSPESPLVTGNTAVCEGGYTTLNADVIQYNTAVWSIGDSVVWTGTTYKTPPLTVSETYSVAQSTAKSPLHVGPAGNAFWSGDIHNTGFEGKLFFKTEVPLRLVSVLVYAQGASDRIIRLYDDSGNVIDSVSVYLVSGDNRVLLNMEIPVPGEYSLANPSQNLYRNNGGASYPYKIDNLISITGSNASGEEKRFYYYFYDWVVKETPCLSPPVDVVVSVEPGPLAAFFSESIDFTADFTDLSTGTPTSWIWNFGDGSPVSNEQNPSHVYLDEGTYQVELTVSNGSCSSTYIQPVYITNTTGTRDINQAYVLKLYPNPATDEVTIDFDQAYAGKIQLNITDATGSLVISRSLESTSTRYVVNTTALTPGTYQFQFIGELGVSVRRIAILR